MELEWNGMEQDSTSSRSIGSQRELVWAEPMDLRESVCFMSDAIIRANKFSA